MSPIRPENRHRYGPDWRNVSLSIRAAVTCGLLWPPRWLPSAMTRRTNLAPSGAALRDSGPLPDEQPAQVAELTDERIAQLARIAHEAIWCEPGGEAAPVRLCWESTTDETRDEYRRIVRALHAAGLPMHAQPLRAADLVDADRAQAEPEDGITETMLEAAEEAWRSADDDPLRAAVAAALAVKEADR